MKERKNQTKHDAFIRVLEASMGSCVQCTAEYLDGLEQEIEKWLEAVKKYRAKNQK